MRNRIDVDILGNTTNLNKSHYLNKEDRKCNRNKGEKAALRSTIQMELLTPLIFAQFTSLFPIYGISSPDYRKLRFKWKSWRLCYSMGLMALNTFHCILAVMRHAKERETSFRSLGDIVFFGGTLVMSILFLILARQWKDLIGKWAALQSKMNNFESSAVQKKIRLLTKCIIFSSIYEHILLGTRNLLTKEENPDRLKLFLVDPSVSSIVGYNVWLAFFFYIDNFLLTLMWNFTDIFLTVVSLSLANMFEQFNEDIKTTAATVSNVNVENALSYWKKKRELYNHLSLFAKTIEDKISCLVLISFSTNLYFICIQLLNSIQSLTSLLRVAYFCTSFGHILFRTCTVCFAATSIYEHSKGSLPILHSVPSEQFNTEVKRLIKQVTSETLALTGCKFFTVTRTLMLTITGTIVTYEVILFQFNSKFDE